MAGMEELMEELIEIRDRLRVNPKDAGALRQLGRYYLKNGFYKQAREQYSFATFFSPSLIPAIILDYEEKIKEPEGNSIGARLSLAGFHLEQGETDSALLELEEVLEIDPKNTEAYNALGKILIKLERIDEAIKLLERSLEIGLEEVALRETLAGAYLEKGRIEDAIKFYGELLNYQPGAKHLLRVLAELHSRLNNFDTAAKCYLEMFSDDPEVSKEVIQKLEELLEKAADSIYIREVLAEVYVRSLQPDLAVEKLQQVLELERAKTTEVGERLRKILKSYPGHPSAILALGEVLILQGAFSEAAENYHNLVSQKKEFMKEAVAGYKKILEYCPSQILARNFLAEAYLYKNQISEVLDEFEKIIEHDPEGIGNVIKKCRDIIKRHPELFQAHLVLGKAYLACGEIQRAILEAEGILSLDKKYTPAYLLLGEAYVRQKLCRKAVEFFHAGLALDPYNADIHEKYKEAKEKELELEEQSLKSQVCEDPWKMSLHLDLAKIYLQKGKKEEAIRELQIALRDCARAPFAYNLLGKIYKCEGRFDLAQNQFSKALENIPPELADLALRLTFNLGGACEAQGLLRKALKAYEQVLSRNIDFGDLSRRVKRLKETSLFSVRNKMLLAATSKYRGKQILGIWGRQSRKSRAKREEEENLSFSQKHNSLGFEYFVKGMHKAAMEEFGQAARMDPKNTSVLNNLSITLAHEGRLEEALRNLSLAISIQPDCAILHNNLGVIYYLKGGISQAEKELNQAAALDPDLAGICLNRGDIYYSIGKVQEAIEDWKKIGEYDPLSELASDRLLYKIP